MRVRKWALAFLLLLGVPSLGLATAAAIEADFEAQYANAFLALNNPAYFDTTLAKSCREPTYRAIGSSKCELLDELAILRAGSVIVAGISLGVFVLIGLMGAVAGRNRTTLIIAFRFGLYVVLIVLAFGTLGQVAIAIFATVELERVYLGTFSGAVIGSVGVGGLAAAWRMLAAGFAIQTPPVTTPVAVLVRGEAHSHLWGLVRDVAQKAGTSPPDHILLGLGMDFYATAMPVRPIGDHEVLSGETLHLSLPLMRVLSAEDLSGIIGHELGHFRGGDAAYTLRFLPVYLGVTRALQALSLEGGRGKLMTLPAMVLLTFFLSRFALSASRIGREREIKADEVGAGVCGREIMARSLLRATAFSLLWRDAAQSKIDAINRGALLDNLSAAFQVQVATWVGNLDRPALIAALSNGPARPPDRHSSELVSPPTCPLTIRRRARRMARPARPSSDLIDGLDAIETDLTMHLAELYIDLGLATPQRKSTPVPDAPRSRQSMWL